MGLSDSSDGVRDELQRRDSADESAEGQNRREPRYNWSRMSLDELVDVYWRDIAPKRRREGFDPDWDVPRYNWLADFGFSGIAYALREHHDLTPKQFFTEVVGLEAESREFEWELDHGPTVDALESHLRSLSTLGKRAESTVETHRTRLGTWVKTYRDLHGTDDLLSALNDVSRQPREIDRCVAVLEAFDQRFSTDRSKLEYMRAARSWYGFLRRRGIATYSPLAEIDEELGWEAEKPDNRGLAAEQVRRINSAVESPDERLLVVALAGWGLRPSEAAALHVDQTVLDDGDPRLSFGEGERKNGPGEVTLLFGVDVLTDRIDALGERSEWNGYLFPSRAATDGHISPNTVRRRFKRLADRADVRVDGETPTPKMGRRFWYSAYQEAVGELLGDLEDVAADQGSSSARVVASNYLSAEQRRQARRDAMRETLSEAFGEGLTR